MENHQPSEQILQNAEIFNRSLHKVKAAVAKNNLDSALAWAQITAHFAFIRHPGFYSSAPLEDLLLQVAQKIENKTNQPPVTLPESQKKDDNKLRFLYVITEGYETGGHSQFIAQWIKNTSKTSVHSLIETADSKIIPEILTSAITASGGWYKSLSTLSSSLAERSLILRQLARGWADVIVLFTHPFDPIPTAAFGIEGGPPIIFCNHADHAFWLGISISDVIANYHVTGGLLGAKRRGILDFKLLPIPLSRPELKIRDEVARNKLGLRYDEIMLLTVGRDEKFLPFENYNFLDVMIKFIKKHSKLKLFAVGPSNKGRWKEASDQTDGRISALGLIDRCSLESFYNAADLYVVSFPCGSGTALLEAGLHNIPSVCLRLEMLPHICGADDVAFENSKVHVDSAIEFISSLEYMIEHPYSCSLKALEVKENIENSHCTPGWNSYLIEILKSLPATHQIRSCKSIDAPTDCSDEYLVYVDAEMLSNELTEHSFSRLVRVYSKHLSRSEVVQEQAKCFLGALPKVGNVQKAKEYLYNFREFLFSSF